MALPANCQHMRRGQGLPLPAQHCLLLHLQKQQQQQQPTPGAMATGERATPRGAVTRPAPKRPLEGLKPLGTAGPLTRLTTPQVHTPERPLYDDDGGWVVAPTRCTLREPTVRFSRRTGRASSSSSLVRESSRAGSQSSSKRRRRGSNRAPPPPCLLQHTKLDHHPLAPQITQTPSRFFPQVRPERRLSLDVARLWAIVMEELIKSGKHQ